MAKSLAFGYFGGKFSHLDWLLPRLGPCRHYCEPFGGSAAVLLNRTPSPVETYNDLDAEVVTFFRVLREQPEALLRAIGFTPFARAELALACTAATDDLERARRFYVRARQARTGLAQTATPGRWAYCTQTSRAGMAGAVSRWLGATESLATVADRLLRVQIECRPALEVIARYDSPETLFYCDPPYVHATRGDAHAYRYEMTDADHEALAATLAGVQGRVALSNYDHPLLDRLYPAPRWRKHVEAVTAHSVKERRAEVLWTNYDVA